MIYDFKRLLLSPPKVNLENNTWPHFESLKVKDPSIVKNKGMSQPCVCFFLKFCKEMTEAPRGMVRKGS